MKTLDQISIEHGTDKATSHPIVCDGRGHCYAPIYDSWFTPLRHLPIKFLEIGVGGGESIRTWLDYFTHPNTRIFGVDIVHSTNPWNTPGQGIDLRYVFVTGDQSSETFWQGFLADYGANWDVLVDDGGHCSNQIITTWRAMWPHIVPGGYYCIEDLCTAYASISGFCPDGWQNHMTFVKDKLDAMNHGLEEIESLHFSRELAIFKKR